MTRTPAIPSPVHRRLRGLTLVELLLALAITALIGAAIAAMFFAVSYGTSSRNDLRGLVVRQRTLTARLDASVRGSAQILAAGGDYVVLWMGDSRANKAPDLSELRRIEYDSAGKTLISYKAVFPAGWTQAAIDAADTSYALTADFNAVTKALKGNSLWPSETWMTNVTEAALTYNNASASSATLVSYRFTLGSGTTAAPVAGAAALRKP